MNLKSITKETWTSIREYIFIAFGLLMYSSAWKGFLLPHLITGGGVTGIGAIVFYATGIPISITYFAINFVLLVIAVRSVGLAFSLRTIYGVAILTFFFAIIPQAVPGTFVGADDNFMACVLGG
ncbi:MAG: YitT family protein, partial [Paludibacter sp.]|nr:YitT family protein [Paludibacter sp.]